MTGFDHLPLLIDDTPYIQSLFGALHRVQAIIEFDVDGHVLDANDNYLQAVGYTKDEIVGRHHRLFCETGYAASGDYQAFWNRLREGEIISGEFKRYRKDGQAVWLQASYNPVRDANGRVLQIIKFATDVTQARRDAAMTQGMMDAIHRSQAIMEFDLSGHVLDVNARYLRMTGYTREEVVGRHHSTFCDPEQVRSAEYRHFWADLRDGQFKSGRFRRIGKHQSELWIQATYNPVFDLEHQPCKVVKLATDITDEVHHEQDLVRQRQAAENLLAQLSDATSKGSQATLDIQRRLQEIASLSKVLVD